MNKGDRHRSPYTQKVVEGDRFELPNPVGTDLQSAAFSHFATPPDMCLLIGYFIISKPIFNCNKKLLENPGPTAILRGCYGIIGIDNIDEVQR